MPFIVLMWFLCQLPELPAEFGLAVEHLQAIFGFGPHSRGVSHQTGGGGIVDEVVDEDCLIVRLLKCLSEREWGAVDVGVGADGGGVDKNEE